MHVKICGVTRPDDARFAAEAGEPDKEGERKLRARGLDLVADNAWNEGAVLGPRVEAWRGIDLVVFFEKGVIVPDRA